MGQQRKKQESNNRLPKGRGGRHGNSDVHIVTHVAERRGRVERSQRDRSVGAINTSFTLFHERQEQRPRERLSQSAGHNEGDMEVDK